MVFDIKFTINLKKNISFEIKKLKSETSLLSLYENILSDYIIINNNQIESFMGFDKADNYHWVTLKENKIVTLAYEILSNDNLILLCIKTDILFKYIRYFERTILNEKSNEIEESLWLIIDIIANVVNSLSKEEKNVLDPIINKLKKLTIVPDKKAKTKEEKKITIDTFIDDASKSIVKPLEKEDASVKKEKLPTRKEENLKIDIPVKKKKIEPSKPDIDKEKNIPKVKQMKKDTELSPKRAIDKENKKADINKPKVRKKKIISTPLEKTIEKSETAQLKIKDKIVKEEKQKKPEIIIPMPLEAEVVEEKLVTKKEMIQSQMMTKPNLEKPKERDTKTQLKVEGKKLVKKEIIQEEKAIKENVEPLSIDKNKTEDNKEEEKIEISKASEKKLDIIEDNVKNKEESLNTNQEEVKVSPQAEKEEIKEDEQIKTEKLNEVKEELNPIRINAYAGNLVIFDEKTSINNNHAGNLEKAFLNLNVPSSYNGGFLDGIGGYYSQQIDKYSYGWGIFVDGVQITTSLSEVKLTGGETVTLRYVRYSEPDFALDYNFDINSIPKKASNYEPNESKNEQQAEKTKETEKPKLTKTTTEKLFELEKQKSELSKLYSEVYSLENPTTLEEEPSVGMRM